MTAHLGRPLVPRAGSKVIRDTIHGYITVDARLVPLIDHPYMQRLRRVSQTSMSSLVYPTMTGTRFEHSLGAMHVAQSGVFPMWINSIEKVRDDFRQALAVGLSPECSEEEKITYPALMDPSTSELDFIDQLSIVVGAAALLHDVGHTAYSHALEPFFATSAAWISSSVEGAADALREYRSLDALASRDFHEVIGLMITERIQSDLGDALPWTAIRRLLWSPLGDLTCESALHDYISGEVDVDRIDYLLRDSNNSGTGFGSFDASRLLDSLAIHRPEGQTGIDTGWMISFGVSAMPALEDFIECRYQYYRRVALHNKVFGYNRLLDVSVRLLRDLEQDGQAVTTSTPTTLNYFPCGDGADHSLAGDDGAITEWLKTNLAGISVNSQDSAEIRARKSRFLAAAQAVFLREKNWISLWKTDYDFERICGALQEGLMAAVYRSEAALNDALTEGGQRVRAVRGLSILVELKDTFESQRQLDPDVISIPPFGPTALMNAIGRVLLADDSGSERSREMQVADNFGLTCSDHVASAGYWVFGYQTVVTARGGFEEDPAAQVYENNEVIRLADRSGHFITRLANVEAARPQFRCYFVFTGGTRVDSIDIRTEFMQNFPRFAEDMITALILPQ